MSRRFHTAMVLVHHVDRNYDDPGFEWLVTVIGRDQNLGFGVRLGSFDNQPEACRFAREVADRNVWSLEIREEQKQTS